MNNNANVQKKQNSKYIQVENDDDLLYKGSMYLRLSKNMPSEMISFLSDLELHDFDASKYESVFGNTPFFKDSVWKYISVDFGRVMSTTGHTIEIGYNCDIIKDYSDYHFDCYYLFIYFRTFSYYRNAEKLIDVVKDQIIKGTPEKIGEIHNVARNYHSNVYLSKIRPDLSKYRSNSTKPTQSNQTNSYPPFTHKNREYREYRNFKKMKRET